MTIRKKAKKAIDDLKSTFTKKAPKREITPPPEPVKRWCLVDAALIAVDGHSSATQGEAVEAAKKIMAKHPGRYPHGIAVVQRFATITNEPKVAYDEAAPSITVTDPWGSGWGNAVQGSNAWGNIVVRNTFP